MCVSRISQDSESGLLMRHFRPKGVSHADPPVRISARKGVRFIEAFEKLMNDYSFVNNIDSEIARSQAVTIVFELVWIRDHGWLAFGLEVPLQHSKLACCSHILPVNDGDLRALLLSAPIAISVIQSTQQAAMRLRTPVHMP